MTIVNIITLLGGLAFFLFGMQTMSDGLSRLGGGRFERALETMTKKPINGVLLGALITAIIQSSSATTVMVVGFVNSGIMQLSQTVGIIMGANLGTTITSWILSLANLDNGNPLVQMLMPKNFALVLALVGAGMTMFVKRGRKHDLGRLFLGFGMLMQGMTMMSGAVAPLGEMESFRELMLLFSDPLLGLAVGALMTAVMQASAASIGILQALSGTGMITFGSAIPIILGQNIGTCVTAMLSGIGANKNAKRAAAVHLYFNVIGSLFFVILLYIGRAVSLPLLAGTVDSTKIAIFHTVFNTATILLLLPFHKLLEKLAILTVRDKKTEKDDLTAFLDDRFLNAPAFAVEQCTRVTHDMAVLSFHSLEKSIDLLTNYDAKAAEEILAEEEEVDKYEDKLGAYLVKLNESSLSEHENRTVSNILLIISDFERISDHAVNIVEAAQEIHDKKIVFSPFATKELERLTAALKETMDNTLNAYIDNDTQKALLVEPLEEVIDLMKDLMKANHIKRIVSNQCTIELGFVFNDLITNIERVSDHCSNIALSVLSGSNKVFENHEYVKEVESSSEFFAEQYEKYKQIYYLPIQ
ncbi:MAG: Na/Pi cotransporter family protein [Ruminococcaceae bacterium]|nr:Na/Pi cotransporter family protein [Oscillospiraceae bacterium]